MFGTYFYHERIRKAVASFGAMFDNIYVLRKNSSGHTVSTQKVPLSYGPRSKFLDRIREQANLATDTKTAIRLPRMAFEIVNISYDPTRQLPKTNNINKAIEGCRNKQIIGAALETEVNYLPEDKVVKDSLNWLERFGNEDVDLFRDWLIVSNFQVVSDLVENSITIDNNEFGKIQILKAQGQKCDRCWHYQKETFSGIQNTKLCKRCSNIINLEFT